MNNKYLLLTYPQFLKFVLSICTRVKKDKDKYKIDFIISVQRGGAVMSKIISDILDIPIRSLTVKAYKGKERSKGTILTEPLSQDIRDKTVLVLDEISDTGKTLLYVKKYLTNKHPKKIIVATMFIKSWTKFIPDIYIKETDKWIVFPYELKEMYNLVNGDADKSSSPAYKKYLSANGVGKLYLKKLFTDI